jgi:hypothetical protein
VDRNLALIPYKIVRGARNGITVVVSLGPMGCMFIQVRKSPSRGITWKAIITLDLITINLV